MDLDVNVNDMPISFDDVYNLIVCKDCGFGVPLEWIPSHFRENHGIKRTSAQAMAFLDLERDAMTFEEAKDWISSVWIGRAVLNIPIIRGYKCNVCQYSAATMKVMTNHFCKKHKGMKAQEHHDKCKVQLVFKGGLQKYIQIEEAEDTEIEFEEDREWISAIDQEFGASIANIKVGSGNGKGNLRLMNVFIAKTRWDVLVEDMDLKEIVRMASVPTVNQSLHKIILCGRRYIHKTCEELDRGSIIVKRLLMSGSDSNGGVFDSLQENKSMNDYGNMLGRMVCMFLRVIDPESEFGEQQTWLMDGQRQTLQDTRDLLISGDIPEAVLDEQFHSTLKELFF